MNPCFNKVERKVTGRNVGQDSLIQCKLERGGKKERKTEKGVK